MADNSPRIAAMARLLAVAHIIIGFLLVCFGIGDRVVENYTGYAFYGVWSGVWMCISGGLGIPGSGIERTTYRSAFAGIFMGFSITSAVFGGIIIIAYSIALSQYPYSDYSYIDIYYSLYGYDARVAMHAVMLILGIAAFVVGIWAPICCCLLRPCCPTQQGQQAMYTTNQTADYVMTSGGVPVAAPLQTGQGMFSAQGAQSGMVLVPISGASGGQPQMIQASPSGAMVTGYSPQVQPQFVQMSPSNEKPATGNPPPQSTQGGYMPLNEEA